MKIKIGKRQVIFRKRFFIWIIFLGIVGFYTYHYVFQDTSIIKSFEKGRIVPIETGKDKAIQNLKDQYKNKLVIVFFYDGYSDQNQALTYINVLKTAITLVEPFKSYQNEIVFKSFTTDGNKCHVSLQSDKKYLLCDSKLIDSFRSLGIDHFKLVILSPLEFTSAVLPARGANSWMTVSTHSGLSEGEAKRLIGTRFMQLLGRSLGLATEADNTGTASTSATAENSHKPNCAKDEAEAKAWWGGLVGVYNNVGYFKGCLGQPQFVYPQEGTIMSPNPTLESYGIVSENYLRGVVSCFYLNQNKPIFPAGQEASGSAILSTCSNFKKEYPKFWEE